MYHYFPCEVNKGLFGISRENNSSGLPSTFFEEKTSLACSSGGFLFKVSGSPEKIFPLEIPKKSLRLPCKVVTNSYFLIPIPTQFWCNNFEFWKRELEEQKNYFFNRLYPVSGEIKVYWSLEQKPFLLMKQVAGKLLISQHHHWVIS